MNGVVRVRQGFFVVALGAVIIVAEVERYRFVGVELDGLREVGDAVGIISFFA